MLRIFTYCNTLYCNSVFEFIESVQPAFATTKLAQCFIIITDNSTTLLDMASNSVESLRDRIPREVYICAAIEFLTTFSGAITSIPTTRLIESAVCQRYDGTEREIAEHLCKESGVKADMAQLLGAMASFSALPGLRLTIPYGILAEHIDRRFILLANSVSNICRFTHYTKHHRSLEERVPIV